MFTKKQSGYLWLIAAIIVWIWEFLLHYSKDVLIINDSFEILWAVSLNNLFLWHFLIIVWIPLYFIWYYHLYLMLKWWSEKLARTLFFLWVIAFITWWIWIASRWFMWNLVHIQDQFSFDTYEYIKNQYIIFYDSLLQVLRYTILLISGLWIYLILTWKTHYPKWFALLNPIALLLLVFSTVLIPTIWKYLMPIAMNVVHVIIFSFSLYVLHSNNKTWK